MGHARTAVLTPLHATLERPNLNPQIPVLQIRLGDELLDAPPDSYAYAPPGVVHTISNPGDQPARFLGITAPGGLDAYLRDLAADPADFPAIAARHDVVPVD